MQVPKKTGFLESAIFCLAVAISLSLFQVWLVHGETILSHDNFYWNFPIFHFFAENLNLGHIAWWNPLDHGGEPFFPALVQVRLFDPIALATVGVGKAMTSQIPLLYAWFRFLQTCILACGCYLYLRSHTSNLATRVSVIPLLFFSSWMLGPFRNDGLIHHFLWIPFILCLLDRIFLTQRGSLLSWIALGTLCGLNLMSYFFVGMTVLIPMYLVGLLSLNPSRFFQIIKSQWLGILIAAGLFLGMGNPNFYLWKTRGDFVFSARSLPMEAMPLGGSAAKESASAATAELSYEAIEQTGSPWSLWNLIQALSPYSNHFYRSASETPKTWGAPSDAYIYFGLLGAFFVLLGIFFGKHLLKRLWIGVFLIFLTIVLGPNTPIYRLWFMLPQFHFVRHTSLFLLYLEFALLFFFVLGLDALAQVKWKSPKGVTFLAHVLAIALAVLILSPERGRFAKELLLFAAIPLAIYFFFIKKPAAILVLITAFGVDGIRHVREFSHLYEGTPIPSYFFGTPTAFQKPHLLPRGSAPPCPAFLNSNFQCPRHLSFFYREPFAFSTVRHGEKLSDPFFNALLSERWDALYLTQSYFELLKLPMNDVRRILAFEQLPIELVSGRLTIEGYSYQVLTAQIESEAGTSVIWHDAYHPFWKAFLDGAEIPITTMTGFEKKILVPAGKHAIRLRFDPVPFRKATAVYVALGFLGIICFFWEWARSTASPTIPASAIPEPRKK